MKRFSIFPVLVCISVSLLGGTVCYAQKNPDALVKTTKQIGKTCRATQKRLYKLEDICWQSEQQLQRVDISSKIAPQLTHEELRAKKHLPRPPEQLIRELLPEKFSEQNKDLLQSLEKLWALQDRYGNHNLFAMFLQKYYSQNFGIISPHSQMFFNKIAALNDRELEKRVLKRFHYLAHNKDLLTLAALPQTTTQLSSKAFRIRYLSDIDKITAKNFQEDLLVISIERPMSLNLQRDFSLRHISGHATLKIGQQLYPIYQFNGPLDNITMLYRFLLNGTKRQPLTVVFDKDAKSMAIYNADRSMWLRITSHEYSFPERLHIHLNELRTITFTNCYGVEKTERVNFNLSIPLAVPENLPGHHVQEFLYQKLIENPVKFFKGDHNVTIERHPIF